MKLTLLIWLVCLVLSACQPMSEKIIDVNVGLNGGFESVESGLPVNWMVYTAKSSQNGDFDITLDTQNFIEGKQSLRFDVRSCSSAGGRFSPGIAQEISVDAGKHYTVSFWVKNSGTEFQVLAGGISTSSGVVQPLLRTSEAIGQWRFMNYTVSIPLEFTTLRLEITVLKPGTFWIDGIAVEKR